MTARALMIHRVIPQTDRPANVNIVANASVTVYQADGVTLWGQSLYAAATGGSPIANPLTADSTGLVYAYTDAAANGTPLFCKLSAGGLTQTSWFLPDPGTITVGTGPYPEVNVLMYGATGNGSTDDTVAIQAAIDAVPSTGGVLYIPGGPGTTYVLNSSVGSFSYADASSGGNLSIPYSLQLKSNLTVRSDGATLKRGTSLIAINTFIMAATTAVTDVRIENLKFDQSATSTTNNASLARSVMLFIRYGSARITLDRVDFINCGTQPAMQMGSSLTTESAQIDTIDMIRCSFRRSLAGPITSSPGNGAENTQVAIIWNASHVTVDDVRFFSTLTGATAGVNGFGVFAGSSTACGASTPMQDITVKNCTFRSVQCSALFVRGVASTYIKGVRILDNDYMDGGKWIEKGFLALQDLGAGGLMFDVVVSRNAIRNWGYANSSAGVATPNAAQAILWGNDTITGLVCTDNTIDGAQADNTLPYAGETAPSGRQFGIAAATMSGAVIGHNTILNCGGPGIFIDGGTGAAVAGGVSRLIINHNDVVGCAQKDDGSTTNDAGILLNDFIENFEITNNTCINNGSNNGGTTQTAGIGFIESTAANSGVVSGLIAGNICRDDRVGGARKQKYGIRLGNSASGTILKRPTGLRVIDNDVGNNVTAGIFADTTYGTNTRNYDIENNRAWMMAQPVNSSMTGSIASASMATQTPITVTGATVGDQVVVTTDAAATPLAAGLVPGGTVISANTVTAFITNTSGGALTPNGGTAYNLRIRVRHLNRQA